MNAIQFILVYCDNAYKLEGNSLPFNIALRVVAGKQDENEKY